MKKLQFELKMCCQTNNFYFFNFCFVLSLTQIVLSAILPKKIKIKILSTLLN